jgi:hypothetical protein
MATGKSIVGAETVSGQRNICLLLADVDGTLVTKDKVPTAAAKAAARELLHAGIAARRYQRPAATWHEHADPASRSAGRYRRL